MVSKNIRILNMLKEHVYFQECILENISFYDYGTTIVLTFNYIWSNDFKIRPNLDEKQIMKLRFSSVNRFVIDNELSNSVIDEPKMINWGFNEISKINLIGTTNSSNFLQVEILWETKRKILIEFSNMDIE
jgi:hypothetical protein